eukprot:CAMPEP_0117890212 /NCGR_PEP_ID=MMETSP0950-20121206/23126_1 /TAXON_ID=44440 /ORGANISM="Chattonella subsalsa, Strain CCMP2191" /LENGTH=170 /DNA_ID=CAMNT_0005749297 /DNA_START=254 /DNA_END=763 /DNA_ORIENTATION=+
MATEDSLACLSHPPSHPSGEDYSDSLEAVSDLANRSLTQHDLGEGAPHVRISVEDAAAHSAIRHISSGKEKEQRYSKALGVKKTQSKDHATSRNLRTHQRQGGQASSRLPSAALISRLSAGQAAKVSVSEAQQRTKRVYHSLPDVVAREAHGKRKQEHKERLIKIKQMDQ